MEKDILEIHYCCNCKKYMKNHTWCTRFGEKREIKNRGCANIDYIDDPKEFKDKKDNIKRATLKLDVDYVDLVESFYDIQPFYYDKNKIWWLYNFDLYCWEIVDETDMFVQIYDIAKGQRLRLTSNSVKSEIKEAFKIVGRQKKPTDMPKSIIQFKNKGFDINTGRIFEIDSSYFNTNPIPQNIGETSDTPTIDKLFEEWVGKNNIQTLYEIIAYCCLTDYPIHLVFCLIGCGRNGKSRFLALLNKFIGSTNICSTELDTLLDSRFESCKLYRKLVCSMGETNFGVLNKTSLLKKLCGQDLIGFEFKNKLPFDDYNYAKILISSNSLPTSEDTSEGFYRRWLIIDFPNTFSEGKDILDTIPKIEYSNLAKKVTEILPDLLSKGQFSNQGSIEQRKAKYILSSNPLPTFINLACYKDGDNFVKYSEFYLAYVHFLNHLKKRVVTKREFGSTLTMEGYEISRTSKKIDGSWVTDRYILGISLIPDWEKFMTNMTFMQSFSTGFTYSKTNREKVVESHESHETKIEVETITDE